MKNKKWLGFNIFLFVIFLVIYASAFVVKYLLGGFLLLWFLLYYSVFLLTLNLVGIIYFWKKGNLTYALKVFGALVLVSTLTFFSVPVYRKISYFINVQRGLTKEQITMRSTENYNLLHCKDNLENDIVVLNCSISVKLAGSYEIKGNLSVKNHWYTGYDEVLMESSSRKYKLGSNSNFTIYFDHRHDSKNRDTNSIPDGPYTIELFIAPTENKIARKVYPFVLSGYENKMGFPNYRQEDLLKTEYYSGTTFENLPLMKSSFEVRGIDESGGHLYIVK